MQCTECKKIVGLKTRVIFCLIGPHIGFLQLKPGAPPKLHPYRRYLPKLIYYKAENSHLLTQPLPRLPECFFHHFHDVLSISRGRMTPTSPGHLPGRRPLVPLYVNKRTGFASKLPIPACTCKIRSSFSSTLPFHSPETKVLPHESCDTFPPTSPTTGTSKASCSFWYIEGSLNHLETKCTMCAGNVCIGERPHDASCMILIFLGLSLSDHTAVTLQLSASFSLPQCHTVLSITTLQTPTKQMQATPWATNHLRHS